VALIQEIVPELGGEIIELVVRPDHVHLFGHFPPTLAPDQTMAGIKGLTSHTLRQEFPALRCCCWPARSTTLRGANSSRSLLAKRKKLAAG
jgi:REP element-mobilizing transposase RayT